MTTLHMLPIVSTKCHRAVFLFFSHWVYRCSAVNEDDSSLSFGSIVRGLNFILYHEQLPLVLSYYSVAMIIVPI